MSGEHLLFGILFVFIVLYAWALAKAIWELLK